MQKFLIVASCRLASTLSVAQQNLVQYVDPFIGTAKMGHTFPGATVPFGSVQLSPDTDTLSYEVNGKYNPDIYKYCAGYQYTDPTIVGFSHTHFSGTGHSDLGDLLLMPTAGKLQLNPGTADNPKNGFRSAFRKETEKAEPDYYRVHLDDDDIEVELTTSTRVGMHRYTFNKSENAHVVLDLVSGIYNYENKNVWTYVRMVNDSTMTGFRQTNGWARTRIVYFAITFSKKVHSYGMKNFAKKEVYRGFWRKFDVEHNFPEFAGTQLRGYFDFDVKPGEQLLVKVALSPVSMENAMANMQAEIPHWDFDRVKSNGQNLWNKELGKVLIEGTEEVKRNFYTSMYHAFLSPTVYEDVNGQYKGLDQDVHTSDGFVNYTTFSLWDTYRALHPLLNILQPERNSDMAQSMVKHFEQSPEKMLPVWSHYANENWCMIGYHSVSVLADAIVSERYTGNANEALNACVQTARNRWYEGLGAYIDKGYVPEDVSGSSVSKTLEYAYDDYCIAMMAKKLNRQDMYDEFIKRSENFLNVFDSKTGFMRPKLSDGTFKSPFDVLDTHEAGYIEGNSWNYSLYVPQNPEKLIGLMGGNKRFIKHLDSLFTMQLPDKYFEQTEDISRDGIIGNYVHGNEPSHHVVYLYNFAGAPGHAQRTVRMIMEKMYHPQVDGLGGNDDCGQMSAWYIFSALGFYPVAPASGYYSIGSPAVDHALINLGNGKQLEIVVNNQGKSNVLVKKVSFNGKQIKDWKISQAELLNGGKLVFILE